MANGLLIVGNIAVTGREADFDVVMDVDALYHLHFQACGMGLADQTLNFILRPYLADRDVIERADHSLHAGHLAYML